MKVLDQIRRAKIMIERELRKQPSFVLYLNHDTFEQMTSEIDIREHAFYINPIDCDFIINGCKGYRVSNYHPPFRVVAE